MRLKINLATRPYRDVRQFLRTWGSGTILLALLTVALCMYTYRAWHHTRNARAQISALQGEIDKLDRDRAEGIALLNQPQNRDVAVQSAFLNSLIARRSFSWTQLFMELERIMPARLHVNSIAPSLNKHNQIEIHMMVGGDARDQALELVKRLEDSPAFRAPELRSEALSQAGTGDRVQFDISMVYVPQAASAQAGADKAPQEQAANGDKAAATAEKDKAVKPATGEKDKTAKAPAGGQDKAVNPLPVGKKRERTAQAAPAGPAKANAAAGRKGTAR